MALALAHYTTQIVTKTQHVASEDCNSIWFENIGKDNATINTDIPLQYNGVVRAFENEIGVTIKNNFPLNFEGKSEDRRVLIIKRFYL